MISYSNEINQQYLVFPTDKLTNVDKTFKKTKRSIENLNIQFISIDSQINLLSSKIVNMRDLNQSMNFEQIEKELEEKNIAFAQIDD